MSYVQNLVTIAAFVRSEDVDAAERIIAMPLVKDPSGEKALETLAYLVRRRPDIFAYAMTHRMLADGMSPFEAPRVALLHRAYRTKTVDVLLDHSRFQVERVTARLPLSGEVDIVTVRTGPGAERNMTLIGNAVRTAENLMARPLPTNYVNVWYQETAFPRVTAGTFTSENSGMYITINPEYGIDDGSHEAEFAPGLIAHEVAHYYWHGNVGWIDEGMASFMDIAIENRRAGEPMNAQHRLCDYATNIAEAIRKDKEYRCEHSLGERLFLDLWRTLGEDAFWQRARNLYDMSQVNSSDRLKYTQLNIDHVRDAFGTDSPDAERVIRRWYDGK